MLFRFGRCYFPPLIIIITQQKGKRANQWTNNFMQQSRPWNGASQSVKKVTTFYET
jgi:hypothetical protein